MPKNIEVEIRGLVGKAEHSKVIALLREKAKFIEKKDRVFIDYSTFLDGEGIKERNRDIRVRCTNGIPEIMIKVGSWGDGENREEYSFKGTAGNFDELVQIFGILGYEKGVLCVRRAEVFEYKGVEISIIEVPNHSYYFEVEVMISSKKEKDEAITLLNSVVIELGLNKFSDNEFFAYIDKLNSEANEVFEYKNYEKGYFKKRFGI